MASHDDDPAALERDAAVRAALQARAARHAHGEGPCDLRAQRTADPGRQPVQRLHPVPQGLAGQGRCVLPEGLSGRAPCGRAGGAAGRGRCRRSDPGRRSASSRPNRPGCCSPAARAPQAQLDDFLQRIDGYDEARNFPGVRGPSYLSVHLRFGTISIRRLAREALARSEAGSSGAAVWLSELIWRDFYHQVLHHHPHVVDASFKPAYDRIEWERGAAADRLFDAWCEGRTGYPLVDAAMAQINQTGYMHNRLRMVVASFLVKDLGIDWRRGEALLRRAAERLRPGRQQWRLAVGELERLRRAAVLPHLQPAQPEPALRSGRPLHPPLPAAAGAPARRGRCTQPAQRRRTGPGRGRKSRSGATIRRRSSTTTPRARATLQRYAVVRSAAGAQ